MICVSSVFSIGPICEHYNCQIVCIGMRLLYASTVSGVITKCISCLLVCVWYSVTLHFTCSPLHCCVPQLKFPSSGFQVENVLIVVAYSSGEPGHAHFLPLPLCREYWSQWLVRLLHYQTQFASDLGDMCV